MLSSSFAVLAVAALPALAVRPHIALARRQATTATPTGIQCNAPVNIAPGSLSPEDGCSWYHVVRPGDTCVNLLAIYPNALDLASFLHLNPSINADCTNLIPDTSVCVTGPTQPAPGTLTPSEGCVKWRTIQQGDTCQAIVDSIGDITLADFYRFNPQVHQPSCDNLVVDLQVCTCDGAPSVSSPSAGSPPSFIQNPSSPSPPSSNPPASTNPPQDDDSDDCDGEDDGTAPAPVPSTPAPTTPAPPVEPTEPSCPTPLHTIVEGEQCETVLLKLCLDLEVEIPGIIDLDLDLAAQICLKEGDKFQVGQQVCLPEVCPSKPTAPAPGTGGNEECTDGVIVPEGADCLATVQLCLQADVLGLISIGVGLDAALLCAANPPTIGAAGSCFQCASLTPLPIRLAKNKRAKRIA